MRRKNFLMRNDFTLFISTRWYGPLRGPTSSSCGCLRPMFFFLQKKSLLCCFGQFFTFFLCPVVALVNFSSNLSNFERNSKKEKKKKETRYSIQYHKNSLCFFKDTLSVNIMYSQKDISVNIIFIQRDISVNFNFSQRDLSVNIIFSQRDISANITFLILSLCL